MQRPEPSSVVEDSRDAAIDIAARAALEKDQLAPRIAAFGEPVAEHEHRRDVAGRGEHRIDELIARRHRRRYWLSRGATGGGERGGGDERHGAADYLELLDQVAVVAGEVKLMVEALVRPRQRLWVAGERAVAGDHLGEDADLLGAGVLGGEAGGEALELGANNVELAELVVVEDKRTLMKKLGKRVLRVELAQALPALPPALADWPLDLTDGGRRIEYHVTNGDADSDGDGRGVGALLAGIAASGIAVRDVESHATSLEEIFVGLVSRRAGQEATR